MNRDAPLPNTLPSDQPSREFLRDRRLLVLGLGVLVGELAYLLAFPAGEDFWAHYLGAQYLTGQISWEQMNREWPYPDLYPYLSFIPLLVSPLGFLPPHPALSAWTALLVIAVVISITIFATTFHRGWSVLQKAGAVVFFSLWPVTFAALFLAQSSPILLAGLAAAFALSRRQRTTLAGLTLSLGMFKPHLLIGVLGGLTLKGCGRPLLGFAAGTAIWLGLSFLASPVAPQRGGVLFLDQWEIYKSLSVSPLGRLYFLPIPVVWALAAIALSALALWWWRRPSPTLADAALGYAAFFVLFPYVRVYDLVLLIPVYVWLLPGYGWAAWASVLLVSAGAVGSLRFVLWDLTALGIALLIPAIWQKRKEAASGLFRNQ